MADLSTQYAGLKLKNPIIAGSSGLTDSAEKIIELEKNGAAAVVLKSIFEEEITMEYEKVLEEEADNRYKDEYLDYFDYRIKEENIQAYIDLITEAKKAVNIPVIASVNCKSAYEWTYFAEKIEKAGADAIELNIFVLPSDFNKSSQENEKTYFDIVEKITDKVSIPVSLKISHYFSNLAQMILKLSQTKISGITLFNRFYSPDFDINNMEVLASNVLSTPEELPLSLRWIGIVSNKAECDLAASTGIHTGSAIIKQILAGADAVQIVSTLYKNGTNYIDTLLKQIEDWMAEKNFNSLQDFKGKMSRDKTDNPALYERVQFMKYFSDKDQ